MGQNQSLPGGTEIVIIDETLQIVASRKCGDHTGAGHTRPLPPPRSREHVIAELRKLCSPKVSPPTDDASGPTGTKRGIEAVEEEERPVPHQMDADTGTPAAEKKAQIVEASVHSALMPSDGSQPPKKKKRLFANEQAVKAAQKISEQSIKRKEESFSLDSIASGDQEGVQANGIMEIDSIDPSAGQVEEMNSSRAAKRSGPFIDDDSADEGYYTYSPSSPETSFNEDDGDELVKNLAKLHRRSIASRSDPSEAQVPTPPDSPTLRKLQEEDESAEQSRRLREQKLSGQAVDLDKHKDFTASGSFLDDDLILTDSGGIETEVHRTSRDDSKEDKNLHTHSLASNRNRSGPSTSHVPAYSRRYSARVDSPDSEDSELDHPLDTAQSYKTRTPLPKPRLRKINPRTPQYRRFPTRANPYSRHAAESYRTQSRHLSTPASIQQADDSTAKGSSHGEDRLRALTNKTTESSSLPRPLPTFNRSASPVQRPIQKFHGIDLAPRPLKPTMRHRAPYVNDAELENTTGSSPLESETLSSNEVPDSAEEAPARPLSMLEMMARKAEQRDRPASFRADHNDGPALELGRVADIDHEDENEVRDEHERLKEQQKDLVSLETTGLAIASILALGPLNALEAKEEQEFQKFISVVLDAKRSGKSRRARMTSIRGNFDRRLEKEHHVAPDDRIREEYNRLLGAKRVELLNDIRDPLDDLVNDIGAKRKTLTMKRHNSKNYKKKGPSSKKQVRFTDAVIDRETGRIRRDIADGTVIDFDERRQKKRIRPLGKEAKQIALFEEKLQLLKAQRSNLDRTNTTSELPTPAQDSESEISEEDSGAEYVSGARHDSSANASFTASTSFPAQRSHQQLEVDQDLEEINRLENQRQEQDGTSAAARSSYAPELPPPSQRGTQRPDAELIKRMMASKYGTTKVTTRATDDHPFDDLAEASDSDASVASSTSSTSSSSSTSSDQQQVISTFKYTVIGQFLGIEIYDQEQEYVLKTFHDLGRANAYVQQVMISLAANYPAVAANDFELMIRCRKGIYQQVLALGEEELIQASVWIERKEVEIDTGKIRSRKARKAILGEARGAWVVDWEKTVITTVTVEAAAAATNGNTEVSNTNGLTDQEDDDLFGRSPSPPPLPPTATEQITVTRPTGDEFLTNMFTTASLANRRAKELYISWYAQFFPEKQRPYYGQMQPASGSRYEGMLGQIDMALEEELERLGEWNMGCWEEEVASEGGAEKEKMRVWVRRVGVLGPQN